MMEKTYKANLADFGLKNRTRAVFHVKLTDDNVFTVHADVRGVGYGEDLLKHCKSHDYKEQCSFLEKHSMLFDNGYKYGTAWLKEEIPKEDLEEIKVILKIL